MMIRVFFILMLAILLFQCRGKNDAAKYKFGLPDVSEVLEKFKNAEGSPEVRVKLEYLLHRDTQHRVAMARMNLYELSEPPYPETMKNFRNDETYMALSEKDKIEYTLIRLSKIFPQHVDGELAFRVKELFFLMDDGEFSVELGKRRYENLMKIDKEKRAEFVKWFGGSPEYLEENLRNFAEIEL